MAPDQDHLRAISRVYGPETWDVYDLLDRSLDPRGPDVMLTLAAERLTPSSRVLDVGCRDASHLIELVRMSGGNGVGLDPVRRLVEQARKAVSEADLDDRVQIVEATMQDIPFPDASFDLVWCRDVIELVEDLDAGVAEIVRVLRPGGHLVVYTVFATERLEPRERELLLGQSLAVVAENLVEENVEASFRRAGLALVLEDFGGSETSSSGRAKRSTGTSSRSFTGSSTSSSESFSRRSTSSASPPDAAADAAPR